MKLQETLDKPVKYRWVRKSKEEWEAVFQIARVEYLFRAAHDYPRPSWDIDFVAGAGKIGIMGTGNEFTVFATIAKIFDDFLKKAKPDKFEFSAKEVSRQKLYDRFAKKIASKYGYKLLVKNKQDREYHFVKKGMKENKVAKKILFRDILNETKGMTLQFISQIGNVISVFISGKKYSYRVHSDPKEFARKLNKMMGFSEGKALAWLNKNAKPIKESLMFERVVGVKYWVSPRGGLVNADNFSSHGAFMSKRGGRLGVSGVDDPTEEAMRQGWIKLYLYGKRLAAEFESPSRKALRIAMELLDSRVVRSSDIVINGRRMAPMKFQMNYLREETE